MSSTHYHLWVRSIQDIWVDSACRSTSGISTTVITRHECGVSLTIFAVVSLCCVYVDVLTA